MQWRHAAWVPSPSHDFLIQSSQAINIPPQVRIYQNNRNAESRGDVIPIPVGISATEALMDLAYDGTRQRLYIANSGRNRGNFSIPARTSSWIRSRLANFRIRWD